MMGKKLQSGMKVNILPTEIEEIILSKVPVKTILRFMSVCKSWYSLFLNPYFINIHSKNSQNKSNKLLLMHRCKNKDLVVMDSSSSVVCSRLSIDSQLGNGGHDYDIVGSYNGIVCIHAIRHCYNDENWTLHEYFFLWNPALKIIKNIMNSVGYLRGGRSGKTFVGFGFDNHSNDYEVLRFHNTYHTEIQVEIYSLSSDSWRIVNAAPPHYIRRFTWESITHALGVFVNGAHHCDVCFLRNETGYSSAIISFDMGEHVFKEIVIPSECIERERILFKCNESLGILMGCGSTDYSSCIWVMKDYGVPETWTKLCKIDIPQPLETLNLLGFIETNNEVILSRYKRGSEGSIVFDIDKSKAKDTSSFITNTEVLKDAIRGKEYRESLLLFNAANIVHQHACFFAQETPDPS